LASEYLDDRWIIDKYRTSAVGDPIIRAERKILSAAAFGMIAESLDRPFDVFA